jgi:hypothetical protein
MLERQLPGIGTRHLERLVIALSGAFAIWLGYRLFLNMPLAARGPGQLLSSLSAASQPFDGVFDGRVSDATGALPARTVLRREGDSVTGAYSYGVGRGDLSGIVDGDTLLFVWQSGGSRGRARVRASPGGVEFEGTWGHGDASSGGGVWTGARVGR